ncbi:MAG: hypothetical protein RSB70_04900 [Clostridium sp.]
MYKEKNNILIVGLGQASIVLIESIMEYANKYISIVSAVDYNINKSIKTLKNLNLQYVTVYKRIDEIDNLDNIDMVIIDIDIYGEYIYEKLINHSKKDIVLISTDHEYIIEVYENLFCKFNIDSMENNRFILCASIHKNPPLINIDNIIKYAIEKEMFYNLKFIANLEHTNKALWNFFALNMTEAEFYSNNIDIFLIDKWIVKDKIEQVYRGVKEKNIDMQIEECVYPIISNTIRDSSSMVIDQGKCAGIVYELLLRKCDKYIFKYTEYYEYSLGCEEIYEKSYMSSSNEFIPNMVIKVEDNEFKMLHFIRLMLSNTSLLGKGVIKL